MILGYPLADEGLANEAAGLLIVYLGLSIPAAVGVLTYTAAFAAWRTVGRGRYLRIGALALAPLVPLTPIVLGVMGGMLFSGLVMATTVATLAYGIAAGARYMARGAEPKVKE